METFSSSKDEPLSPVVTPPLKSFSALTPTNFSLATTFLGYTMYVVRLHYPRRVQLKFCKTQPLQKCNFSFFLSCLHNKYFCKTAFSISLGESKLWAWEEVSDRKLWFWFLNIMQYILWCWRLSSQDQSCQYACGVWPQKWCAAYWTVCKSCRENTYKNKNINNKSANADPRKYRPIYRSITAVDICINQECTTPTPSFFL